MVFHILYRVILCSGTLKPFESFYSEAWQVWIYQQMEMSTAVIPGSF